MNGFGNPCQIQCFQDPRKGIGQGTTGTKLMISNPHERISDFVEYFFSGMKKQIILHLFVQVLFLDKL